MNPEQMYLANSFLKEKGLSLSEIMKVKNQYSEVYKNEYPYIKSVINKKSESGISYFSMHERISNYQFTNEGEVILANAIYENTKENFDANIFVQQFKFILRILGIKSAWAE